MTDTPSPYAFVANVEAPAAEWGEPIQFGSPIPKMVRRILRMTAAADDTKLNVTLSAAVLAFSRLEADDRAALYAEVEANIEGAK